MRFSTTRDDFPTLVAIGIAAATVAEVSHETVGHGLGCLVVGGRITLLTSVWFRCLGATPLTDAAGPAANLIVGVLALVLSGRERLSSSLRLFLILLGGFNLFWFAGQMLDSGVLDTEDLAYVARVLGWPEAWRVGAVVVGVLTYAAAVQVMTVRLRMLAAATEPPGALRTRTLIAFAAGVASGIAAGLLWARNPLGSALNEASELGLSSLPGWIALRRAERLGGDGAAAPVQRSWIWIGSSVLLYVAFALIQGRGLGDLAH
jgi:hypothetical protein